MADVSIDSSISTSTGRGLRSVVFTSGTVGYFFYIDSSGAFVYSKTTNGGASWGAAVTINSATTHIAYDVWFDKWTPSDTGTLIHCVYFDSTNDIVRWRTLDTSSDTLGTERAAFTGASAVAGRGAFCSITKCKTNGYIYIAFDIDAGAEKGLVRSTNGGSVWSGNLDATFVAASGDVHLLFPDTNGDDPNDLQSLYQSASGDFLAAQCWDSSAATKVTGFTIDANVVDNTTDLTGQGAWSAALRNSDGHLIIALCSERDTATADLRVWDYNNSKTFPSKTALTDITTNIDDIYYPAVFVNQNNGDIYVAYNGKRDGSEVLGTTTKIYYTKSSNSGTTWSAGDTAYQEGATAAAFQVWAPLTGDLFYVGWRVGSTLVGNAVNSVSAKNYQSADGSSTNVGTVTGVSGVVAGSVAASTNVGTPLGVSGATKKADGSSTNVGTVTSAGVSIVGAVGQTNPIIVPTTNLVSYWKLDEASGSRVDSFASNNLGPTNAPGGVAGLIGLATNFVASSSQYLSVASNSSLQMSSNIDFTIAAWVKLSSLPGSTNSRSLVTKDTDSPVNSRDYTLDVQGSQGFRFYIKGGATYIAQTLVVPSTGVWYFLVAWYDSSNGQPHIRINDATTYDSAGTGAVGTDVSSAEFRIGARAYAGFNDYFDGYIDEVSLWKRKLTSAEITSLYNGGSGLTYPFTLSTGSVVTGVSGQVIGSVGSAVGTSTVTANSTRILAANGATSGTCTVDANSAATAGSVGATAGTSTVQANSTAIWRVAFSSIGASNVTANAARVLGTVGNATGVATVLGDGEAVPTNVIIEADGNATGTSVVSGVSVKIVTSVWSATGTCTVSGVSSAPWSAVGASIGTCTVSGVSTKIVLGVFSSTGVSVVTGLSTAFVSGVGAAIGTSTANAVTARFNTAVWNAVGTSVVLGIGTDAAATGSDGNIVSTSVVLGVSARFVSFTATASGTSTVTGLSAQYSTSVYTSAGTSVVSGVGEAVILGAGSVANAAGVATVSANSSKISGAVWFSSGQAVVTGVGSDAAALEFIYIVDFQVGNNPTQSGVMVQRTQSNFAVQRTKSGFATQKARTGFQYERSTSGFKYPS